jgi:hypothetical protein
VQTSGVHEGHDPFDGKDEAWMVLPLAVKKKIETAILDGKRSRTEIAVDVQETLQGELNRMMDAADAV